MRGLRNIFKILPSRYSKQWLWILLVYTAVIGCSFLVGILLISGKNISITKFLSVIAVAFLISLIVTLAGFFGAKFIFMSSSIGIVIALAALMAILSRRATGWENLIGPVVFLEITVLAILIGVVLEIAVYIIRMAANKKS